MARKDISTLRDEAMIAVEKGKLGKAVELYEELEEREPESAAWSKRLGETHRRAGDQGPAVEAFERAAEKFVQSGFLVQAIAVCRMILQIDPDNVTTLERLADLAPAPRVTVDPPREPAPDSEPLLVLADEPMAVADEPAPPAVAPVASPTAAPRMRPAPPLAAAVPQAAHTTTDDRALSTTPDPRAPRQPGGRAPTADSHGPPSTPDPRTPRRPAPAQASSDRAPPSAVDPRTPRRPAAAPQRRAAAVDLSPGSSLDSIELASIVANAHSVPNEDGSSSGITILPLDASSVSDLSLAELELIDEAAPTKVKAPAIGGPARLALIRTPLFAELHPRVLEKLIPRMALVELAAGETLFTEGDAGASLFVISEGEVTVETDGNELARLGPGAFFGEIALVTDLPRSATVRAVSPVQLLGLDRDLVREAAAEQPAVIHVLLRFVRERLIGRMLRTSELFKPFADHDRAELSSRFEIVEAVPGARLIVEGQRADGLYVMVSGRVDVTRDGDPTPVTQLASGDVFGEMSLLSGGGSTANVTTATRVLALRMPAKTFTEVIMTHPQVLAYLGELADRRAPRVETQQFVDLHVDLL